MISLVALVIQSRAGGEGDEGMIADVAPELGYLGQFETRSFLWLRMRSVPFAVIAGLDDRRYQIPFSRLGWLRKIVNYDLSRIRDIDAPYQPFLGELEENRYISNGVVLDPYGLIYDVAEGCYI